MQENYDMEEIDEENNDNIHSDSFKSYIIDNAEKVIKAAVCLLSFLSLLFAVVFWFLKSENNVIMFALFSCAISIYGFYLAFSEL